MIEKDIDIYIAQTLQKNRIDFFRQKNSGFKSNTTNFNTDAYDKPFRCDKYFPDFIFPFNGQVHMIENGIAKGGSLSNKDRKNMQIERMGKWAIDGNCSVVVITSIEQADNYFRHIGLKK